MKFSSLIYIGLALVLGLGTLAREAAAQSNLPEPGDPPNAALISISAPDANGVVTISGAANAVFPTAQIAIRNLYTQETIYVNAGITGSFTASLYGPGNTPFWISPARNIPPSLRTTSGSLPGGPGTIIYGPFPEARTQITPITQLITDGQVEDWLAYPDADLGNEVYALINSEALYVALPKSVPAGSQLVLSLTLNDSTFEIAFDPALPETGRLRRILPAEADLGTLAVATATSPGIIEARIALRPFFPPNTNITLQSAILESAFIRDAEGAITAITPIVGAPPILPEEVAGIVYPGGRLSGQLSRFSISGVLAQGAGLWNAFGRVNTLQADPGGQIIMEMDVTLQARDLPASLVGLDLIGELWLQPVVAEVEGTLRSIPAQHTNNGWSGLLTPSGLAIDNLRGDVPLMSVRVPYAQVIRRDEGSLQAGFRFNIDLPADLPPGLYVPVFKGRGQVGNGELFNWEENGVFGVGQAAPTEAFSRLPLVMNIGDISEARLLWALFYDHPSDGSRGVLPEETRSAALSNRVRFNSPSYILPPGTYPIEPYLPALLANSYTHTTAPLLPLLLPGGRLNASITAPDGTVDDLQGTPILQNQASSADLDERQRFGAQSPVDIYRLNTNNALYEGYPFDEYGEYSITLSGNLEDIYGNRYSGGGTYRLVIAEPLDLRPGLLPGAPLHVGDAPFIGGHIAPGLPADISAHLRFYPLNGPMTERVFTMKANRYGYFNTTQAPPRFDEPGEYVIDYEARYSDPDGRLWAASHRSAGVVASIEGPLIAHGARGVDGYSTTHTGAYRPAWFSTALYPPAGDIQFTGPLRLRYPYHNGDFVVIPQGQGLRPVITVQDLSGSYADWVRGSLPGYVAASGLGVDDLISVEELPVLPVLGGPPGLYSPALMPEMIVNDAYSYISITRPDVTLRQMVISGEHKDLPLYWEAGDPLNQQIGAGVSGLRPGDYAFLFGGAVIRNADANLYDSAAYAALMSIGGANATARIYPPYQGAAGGADGGPLLSVAGRDAAMFFHPTGVQPAQIMLEGDRMIIAGQAAPTLSTQVSVILRSPSGQTREFSGLSSPTGYFYDPSQDFNVEETGVWSVQISLRPAGASSAGIPEAPLPTGGVLGVFTESFPVYVVPRGSPPLEWARGGDVDTAIQPGVQFNINLNIPAGWTEVQSAYALKIPLYPLAAGPIDRTGATANYPLRIGQLATSFPNLEVEGQGQGPASADVLQLNLIITGLDESGGPVIRTRSFTVFHDRLMSFDSLGAADE